MAIQAKVWPSWEYDGVAVVLFLGEGRGRVWKKPGGDGFRPVPERPDDGVIEPLMMSDDEARSLLAALLAHYQGGDDMRMLRQDYLSERARVDKFIDHLTS